MTISQQLGNYIFPFIINDAKGRLMYVENSQAYWEKYNYDVRGNKTHFETSAGNWRRSEYDDANDEVYRITHVGVVFDKRPAAQTLTRVSMAEKLGISLETFNKLVSQNELTINV